MRNSSAAMALSRTGRPPAAEERPTVVFTDRDADRPSAVRLLPGADAATAEVVTHFGPQSDGAWIQRAVLVSDRRTRPRNTYADGPAIVSSGSARRAPGRRRERRRCPRRIAHRHAAAQSTPRGRVPGPVALGAELARRIARCGSTHLSHSARFESPGEFCGWQTRFRFGRRPPPGRSSSGSPPGVAALVRRTPATLAAEMNPAATMWTFSPHSAEQPQVLVPLERR